MSYGAIGFPASGKARWQFLGKAILLGGLACAAWIWIAQDWKERTHPDGQADIPGMMDPLDSRKDVRQIELYSGQSGVLVLEWWEWLESLTHGKRLAWTIAVLSCSAAAGCFLAAAYVPSILETPAPKTNLPTE